MSLEKKAVSQKVNKERSSARRRGERASYAIEALRLPFPDSSDFSSSHQAILEAVTQYNSWL
jgi:hypothetical protein